MKELKISKSAIIGIFSAVIIVIMMFLFTGAFEDCDKSKIYVNQYPFSGKYAVWTEGGLQQQWWGNTYEYSKTTQVEFTGVEKNDDGYVAAGENPGAGEENEMTLQIVKPLAITCSQA